MIVVGIMKGSVRNSNIEEIHVSSVWFGMIQKLYSSRKKKLSRRWFLFFVYTSAPQPFRCLRPILSIRSWKQQHFFLFRSKDIDKRRLTEKKGSERTELEIFHFLSDKRPRISNITCVAISPTSNKRSRALIRSRTHFRKSSFMNRWKRIDYLPILNHYIVIIWGCRTLIMGTQYLFLSARLLKCAPEPHKC